MFRADLLTVQQTFGLDVPTPGSQQVAAESKAQVVQVLAGAYLVTLWGGTEGHSLTSCVRSGVKTRVKGFSAQPVGFNGKVNAGRAHPAIVPQGREEQAEEPCFISNVM